MALVFLVLFSFLPKRDPRKKNYPEFFLAWEVIQLLILGFFAYLYAVILYVVLHPEVVITPLILGAMGVMFVIMGLAMRKIKTNYFIGIKTPWTLENEEVRNKTHQLGGWTFGAAGILIFISGFYTAYFFPIFI